MKIKSLYIILFVIVLLLIIGYFTNWFGLKKKYLGSEEFQISTNYDKCIERNKQLPEGSECYSCDNENKENDGFFSFKGGYIKNGFCVIR